MTDPTTDADREAMRAMFPAGAPVVPEPNPPEATIRAEHAKQEASLRAQASAMQAVRLGGALLALDLLRDAALAAVSRPVPAPDRPEGCVWHWPNACECGGRPVPVDDEPQKSARIRAHEERFPVDDEPRNPYRNRFGNPLPGMAGEAAGYEEGFAAGRGAERERIVAALEADYRANVADGADGIYTDGLHDAWRLTVRRAKRDDLIKPVSGSSEPRKETT